MAKDGLGLIFKLLQDFSYGAGVIHSALLNKFPVLILADGWNTRKNPKGRDQEGQISNLPS